MFCLIFALISLLVIPGICRQKWEVQYSKTVICALKGSTIHLSGSYKHPEDVTVKDTFWTVNPNKQQAINLLHLPDYKSRVQYFQRDPFFFLKLSDVRHEDGGMYCLRILANPQKENYLGFPGIDFRVTELSVEIPEEVVEGDSPVLTCKSTCTLTGSTNFTWYKNGESFSNWTGENQLFLKSVSSEDTGNYSCGVRDQKNLSSPALTLNVRYPPKSVSVSISGSAEIVSGDSVTLSCISDSNPPALNFSWFKEDESSAVGSGQSFSAVQSGRYYCEAHNPYGSRRSASVSLTAAGGGNTLLYATAGFGTAFICICIIIVVLKIMRRKTADAEVQGDFSNEKNKSTSVTDQVDVCDPNTAAENEVMYASITHMAPKEHPTTRDEDEVQYATVHHVRTASDERQTGNERDCRCDDASVIYSTINVPSRN